jgi:SAM-dependent methyltransferase
VIDDVPDPTALYRIRDGIYAADLMIAAVTEFDLFTWLAERGTTTVADVCAGLGVAARPADVLMTLCAAHGLVDRDVAAGDVVTVTQLGRRHLAAGTPTDLRAYYRSLAERPAVRELAAVLRTGGQAAWASAATADEGRDWSARLGDAEFAATITAAMDARGAFLAPRLADVLSDLPVSRLLDVGGSSGIYAAAVLRNRPEARGAVFERPPVDLAARTLIRSRGQDAQLTVHTGDMFRDPLPTGYDTHLYSQVLHDWDRDRVEHLLAASFHALEPGGWWIDHDTHVDADKRGPLPVAAYSVLLMHSTPGKCWSVGELAEIAEWVGFADVEHRPAAGDRSVVLARKPPGNR